MERIITCFGRPFISRPHRQVMFIGSTEADCPLCGAIDEIERVNEELIVERYSPNPWTG